MNKRNNLRLNSIFFLFVILYITVIYNLYSLQIKQTTYFKTLGSQQYHFTHTTMPARAEIFDRTEVQSIAMNKDILSAFIMPSSIENSQELEYFLIKNFPSSIERLKKNKKSHFMFIKRRLTDSELESILNSNLSDIKILKEQGRFYPIESLGILIGITDINNVGVMGVEQYYNTILAGKPSTHILEKDARSGHFYFKKETKIEGSRGENIILSIDSTLQFLLYEELKEAATNLKANETAGLILNPDNGEIIAIANFPDFNPNDTGQLDIETTKNKIISNAYELGSVIKTFLALASLEEGVVTPNELIDCENSKQTTLNGIKFTTWKAHGIIPFTEVMQGSNNIGVAKVALKLGPKLYDHYKKLGFGKKIGILPAEASGYINPVDKWSNASIISLSFGYELSASLLQLAQAFSIIINNGYLIKPRILKTKTNEIIQKEGPFYSQKSIDNIKQILYEAVNKEEQTKASLLGYKLMGKTGSARLLTNGKYEVNRNIFTFMGMVEKGDYRRIIVTFVKEIDPELYKKMAVVYASTIAFPIFQKILDKMLIHDKII